MQNVKELKKHKHELKRKAERKIMHTLGSNSPEWLSRKAEIKKRVQDELNAVQRKG